MTSGIYQITNSINGKIYIGSSVNLATRKRDHFKHLRSNKHQNEHLQNSFNKHGESCFDFSILHECDIDMLIFFEQYFIDDIPVNRLYNICLIAGSSLGLKRSEESKKKMSISKTGKKLSDEHRHKLSLAKTGKTRSREVRLKMSINRTGKIHTEETRAKLSISQTGKKHSKETRAKMSLAQQARQAKKTSLNL